MKKVISLSRIGVFEDKCIYKSYEQLKYVHNLNLNQKEPEQIEHLIDFIHNNKFIFLCNSTFLRKILKCLKNIIKGE